MHLTLTLPLPPKGLRPNDRSPWQVKAGLTRTAREQGRRAMFKAVKELECEVWFIKGYVINQFYKTRQQDSDNIVSACKAYLDGIADVAKQDDKTFRCNGSLAFKDSKNPRLEIVMEIEEIV